VENGAAFEPEETALRKNAVSRGGKPVNAYKAGKRTLPETALQVLGKSGAGLAGDWAGQGLSWFI